MKKLFVIMSILLVLSFFLGCAANMHKIGNGPQGNTKDVARQWYFLYGLVPLNKVDTAQMAGKATNYDIKTEASPVDIILNIFTGYITITSRTVTVTK